MPSFTVLKGSKSNGVQKGETTKPDLTGDQVHVRITASGLCGTDLHFKNNDMVLGHEGVGVVEAVGPEAKYMKKGDRVGWGYEHDSCGHCEPCLSGRETYCPERKMYGEADLDQGSMATGAVWREAFLFKIPDGLSDEAAAPLQCGGVTVFNALHAYNTQPTETVGIMGVGGLGHLAIQFASKMGCRVVVLSGSDRKKDEAFKLGAHEFIATKGKDKLEVSRPLNRIIVTTSAQIDWSLLIPIIAPNGVIYPMGLADGDFSIPYMSLILKGITVQGSLVASRYIHNRCLEFAALHKIAPMTQRFPLTEKGLEDALSSLENGEMRYRGVLMPEEGAINGTNGHAE